MKTKLPLLLAALFCALLLLPSCSSLATAGAVSPSQQTVANAVEDAISIGLVPVLTKNPSYVPAAQAAAAALGTFAGATLSPADVDGFLAKTSLAPADAKVVAGVINAAWAVYSKRYSATVSANVRPDVKLFLAAVADGITAACAAVPKA